MGAAGVGERDEHVVVEPGGVVAVMDLGVHGAHRSEQLEGLVDEVAAEVQEGAAAGGRGTVLAAFEARLEPGDLPRAPLSARARTVRKSESHRRFW